VIITNKKDEIKESSLQVSLSTPQPEADEPLDQMLRQGKQVFRIKD